MAGFIAKHVPPSVAERMSRMAARSKSLLEKGKAQTATMVRTAECAVVGGVLGYVEGRYDRSEILGAPMAPLIGVASHITGFVLGGEEASHFHAVGDAAFAVHANKVGREVGADQKAKANNQSGTTNTALPAGYQTL